MADLQRVSLDEIVVHFQELEDPRSTINQRHPLVSVVVIALLAVLAGAGGPTAIARWAALKEELLLQVLDLPNGVPRKDVFRRVLMALEAGRLPGLLRQLAAVVACRGGRGDRRGATGPGGGRQDGAAESRSPARGWGRCIRSACGPASTACRWGRWPAPRNRTRSRRSPSS